ncbi:MAG: hypothetical protein ABEH43_06015, partial [Flavobacteriales bacterium]
NSGPVNDITYSWSVSAGGNISSSNGDSSIITVDSGGNYTLTLLDTTNSCSKDSTINVVEDTASPSIDVNQPISDLTCDSTTVHINATGSTPANDITFSWSGGNIINSNSDSSIIDLDSADNYNLSLEDTTNGCSNDTTIPISIDTASPNISVKDYDSLDCDSTTIQIDASASVPAGNILYSWSKDTSISNANGDSSVINVKDSGSYVMNLTDTTNGCVKDTTLNVTLDTNKPTISVAPYYDTLDCDSTFTQIDVSSSGPSGDIIHSWNGASIDSANSDSSLIFVSDSGDYQLSITDTTNGCITDTSLKLHKNDSMPEAFIAQPDTFFCTTNSVLLTDSATTTASGNKAYTWNSLGAGNIISGQGTDSVMVDASGDYELIIEDPDNGCTDKDTNTIPLDDNVPTVSIVNPAPDTLNCTKNSDTLDAAGSSTTSGQTGWSWAVANGGNIIGANSDSSEIYVDSAGIYELTVMDSANGFENTQTYVLGIDTTSPNAAAVATDTIPCNGDSILVDASGSSPAGISYSWNGVGIVNANGDSSNIWVNQ